VLIAHNTPAPWWALDAKPRAAVGPALVWYCQEPSRRAYFSRTEAETLRRATRSPASPTIQKAPSDYARWGAHAQRTLERRLFRRNESTLIPRFDAVAVNSHYTAEIVSDLFGLRAAVIPPGLARPGDRVMPFADRKGLVCVTNANAWKNPFAYLSVVAELEHQAERRDIELRVIGPVDAAAMQREATRLGIAERVQLRGACSDVEKAAWLAESRICLSLPLGEPLGLVPVEAMAAGTPVVASDYGGPAEVVADGVTGRLANPLDPREIAARVLELYDDRERWTRFSEAARARVARCYTLDHYASGVESLCREVLERSAHPSGATPPPPHNLD
jgi:glycosyltransferase involved in cell wall biosynthesis